MPALLPAVAALAVALSAVADEPVVAVTPAFAVRHVGVTDADASGTTLAFDTELSNATLSAVSLEQVAFALEVGGKRIVEGIVPRGVEVPPRGAVAITFRERIRYADLPGLLAKTALKGRV